MHSKLDNSELYLNFSKFIVFVVLKKINAVILNKLSLHSHEKN